MKDLYSFDANHHSATETYELVGRTYERILTKRLQLDVFKVGLAPFSYEFDGQAQ